MGPPFSWKSFHSKTRLMTMSSGCDALGHQTTSGCAACGICSKAAFFWRTKLHQEMNYLEDVIQVMRSFPKNYVSPKHSSDDARP